MYMIIFLDMLYIYQYLKLEWKIDETNKHAIRDRRGEGAHRNMTNHQTMHVAK